MDECKKDYFTGSAFLANFIFALAGTVIFSGAIGGIIYLLAINKSQIKSYYMAVILLVISVVYTVNCIKIYFRSKTDVSEKNIKRIRLDKDDCEFLCGSQSIMTIFHTPYTRVRVRIKETKITLVGTFKMDFAERPRNKAITVTYLSDSKIILELERA